MSQPNPSREPSPASPSTPAPPIDRPLDKVDAQSLESFPASDAPSSWGGKDTSERVLEASTRAREERPPHSPDVRGGEDRGRESPRVRRWLMRGAWRLVRRAFRALPHGKHT